MRISQTSSLSPAWSQIDENIVRFRAIDKKNVADAYWHSICTDSPSARAFLKKVGNNHINQMTICVSAADVYERFIKRRTIPPVVTSAKLDELQGNAKALKASIPRDVPLPRPVQSPDFTAGLDALCEWSPSVTVLTDHKGDSGRRWVARELAKRFSHSFNRIPTELVHALIQVGWPDTPLRSVQRELDSMAVMLIHTEVKAEKEQEAEELQTQTAARIMIQRMNRSAVVLEKSQVEVIDALQAQIDRLQTGMSQFPSETQHFNALVGLAKKLQDASMAAEVVGILESIGRDYGLK